MPLPPEIIDQIVDQYVSVARIQTFHEVRDLDEWVNFTGGRDSTAVFYGGENEPYESTFFRNQLRKLRLVIVDETGPGGSDWQMISDGDDYNDGDFTDIAGTGYAPSNIQVDYPNREHQDALWAFVGSCQRLESLAIIASHYLELDRLRWIPQPGYRGLVDLVLHRIWTNVQSILKLLTVAPVNETKLTPVARRVSLEDIKVYGNGGNWDKVFVFLRTQCPDLELFRASQLTYFTSHARHEHNNRPWENWNDIWTNDVQDNHDRHHLHMVDRKLINRGGSEAYCSHYPVSTLGSDSEWGDDHDTETGWIPDN